MASLAHYSILPRDFFNPKKGSTLAEEIVCYGLPYGGLGFVSHILTFYTIIMLSDERSPLRPWKKLSHSSFDLCISLIGLIGGTILTIITLVRCRHHWQLLLIGIWKLSLSVCNGALGTHLSIYLRNAKKKAERQRQQDGKSSSSLPLSKRDGGDQASSRETIANTDEEVEVISGQDSSISPLSWLVLYIYGIIVGFTGLVSLIIHNWSDHPKLHIISYVFSVVVGFCFFLSFFAIRRDEGFVKNLVNLTAPSLFLFILLSALYGDWVLGVMTDNLLGTPSGDSAALYWSYFTLKRFTMFSS